MKIQYKGFIREKIRRNPITIGPDASFFKAQDYIHAMEEMGSDLRIDI